MNQFEIPQNLSPMENIIKVIGVGGGGSNAVKHLYNLNVKNVDFIVCNTDRQHLMSSPIPNKIQLGKNLTKGLGAGCIPERGREAAIESKEEIKQILQESTEMLFIAAGLGGGTGTGAAPIIAEVAKSLNILTVAIVTLPFKFEGKRKMEYAEKGLEELKKHVDSIIIIPNEKLKEIYPGMKMSEAFARADDIVSTAAKSIAEIITNNLHINVDFNDVRTVMQNSGTALMGTAIARGENRALEALKNAINHPLLMNNSIEGARHILLSITTGTDDISTDEFEAITNYIMEASGGTAELIPGYGTDASLGDAVSITLVATGFHSSLINYQEKEIPTTFTSTLITENVNLNELNKTQDKPTTEYATTTPSTNIDAHPSDFKIETIPVTPEKPSIEPQPNYTTSQNNESPEKNQPSPDTVSQPITYNLSQETEKNFNTLELTGTENNPPVAKIIEKEPTTGSSPTISAIEQLSENIKTLSEKSNHIRKQILDLNNPTIYAELINKPAYLRMKEKEQKSTEENKKNPYLKDHSNYTIDENGNLKPGSPYLNDQVD
ncbi:MAG: cell division protein FtsZ [Bacteroidetes bacterium]|nr:MAG: cell division protein FtsZ [Bacteroidota bacterium]